jgi:hypothetical protein
LATRPTDRHRLGAIDLSLEDSDMTSCIALEAYYDKLAILSRPRPSCG